MSERAIAQSIYNELQKKYNPSAFDTMGAIRDFLFPQVQTAKPTKVSDVAAALTPVQISDSVYNILHFLHSILRCVAPHTHR